MMARTEDTYEQQPESPGTPAVSVLLALLAVCFTANDLLAAKKFSGPPGWTPLLLIAVNLLLVGLIWSLLRFKPSRLGTAASAVLLVLVALMGFGAAGDILKVLVSTRTLWGPWAWQTVFMLASNLFIGVGAIWILVSLKPWKGWKAPDEPVSPATRRTRMLFGLSGVVSILGMVALILGTSDKEDPFGVWSNRQNVSPGFAIAAIAIWLLSIAIAWRWYFSADEHERRANDVGHLFGGGLFMAVTPVWWIASRAGLVPPPDAMIIWYATVVAMGIGWAWYRNR
jgi:hypothetical protein